MSSPYINTRLTARVTINPNQMNNNIYTHMKNNLIKRLEGKCYENYGYITRIYEILTRSDAVIEPENPMAAAMYKVSFSCRLCMPLKNRYIICKVEKNVQVLTKLSNGPIGIIVTNDRINKENFIIGKNGVLVKTKTGVRNLEPGDHVRVKIDSKKFNNGDTIIICMGSMESLATQEESAKYSTDEYNISDKFIDYEKYIKSEEKNNDIEAIGNIGEQPLSQ